MPGPASAISNPQLPSCSRARKDDSSGGAGIGLERVLDEVDERLFEMDRIAVEAQVRHVLAGASAVFREHAAHAIDEVPHGEQHLVRFRQARDPGIDGDEFLQAARPLPG